MPGLADPLELFAPNCSFTSQAIDWTGGVTYTFTSIHTLSTYIYIYAHIHMPNQFNSSSLDALGAIRREAPSLVCRSHHQDWSSLRGSSEFQAPQQPFGPFLGLGTPDLGWRSDPLELPLVNI